jgi:hypothetical protein
MTQKLKINELGCPSRRYQISAEGERYADKKAFGNEVAEDSDIM